MDNKSETASGFISKLSFNNGETLKVKQNDIIVLVGPNNVGKSQTLKDIYNLSREKVTTTVVSDIEITKTKGSVLPILEKVAKGVKQGDRTHYSYLGHTITFLNNHSDNEFHNIDYYSDYRDLFVANLDTATRLSVCWGAQTINRNESRSHPIHYAAFESKYRKWLSDSFKKAFGEELIPNTHFGASIPICIGAPVSFSQEFEDEQHRSEAYAEILDSYKQVQDQGDGIKSFTGILLYLMLDNYRTFLIDEPEAFLHPPQARIMGQLIGETLSDNQQAIIATHSEDIIKGLLGAYPERIKIVRITRKSDNNMFSILDNEKFNEIWNDPLLKHSNIMSSLFHGSVVLCESDSDCKFYSIIDGYLKQIKGKYSEVLFIHCGGKHRVARIAKALRSLKIDVCLISDIDLLDDETVFKGVVTAYGIEWRHIEHYYKILVSNLHGVKERIKRSEAKNTIKDILKASESEYLSTKEIKEIHSVTKTASKWDTLKKSGFAAIPSGDATASFNTLEGVLRANRVFLVPVGQLENFVKEVGGHGPEWVNRVLESYPELGAEVYTGVREFISQIDA